MRIMILLAKFDWTLPLKSPVLIFSLILFIILFAPIILNRFRIPHLIGLIIAGALIGPNGLNLMLRDSSIVLFGTVGLLYIMFLAGLEIDLAEFKKNSFKSFTFGMYTFLIPMSIGTAVGLYVLNFSMLSSVLLASMFASHTLIAYPIISKLGVKISIHVFFRIKCHCTHGLNKIFHDLTVRCHLSLIELSDRIILLFICFF